VTVDLARTRGHDLRDLKGTLLRMHLAETLPDEVLVAAKSVAAIASKHWCFENSTLLLKSH
jgi:hypothetical protein